MAADGSIVIDVDLDNKKAQQELNKLNKKIESLNDQIYIKQQQQMPLIEQSKQLGAELDAAKAKLESMKSGGEFFTSSSINQRAEKVKQLQKEWDAVQKKVESYDASIEKSNIALNLTKERAGDIQKQLASSGPNTERMSQAMERMQKNAGKFSMRLREVVRSALIFTVISQGLASLREWFGKVVKTNDEATAAIGRLKGALLTLVQPLVNVIIPAFTAFVNILANVVGFVATIIASLFGNTVEESSDAAESLYEETEAINNVGAAAKKAQSMLAGFDEINKITSESADGISGTATGILPDFSAIQKIPEFLKNLAADMAIKIESLKFSWNQRDFGNPDLWIVFLSGLLGAVIGSMFGGITGTVIGLLLGLSIGIIACSFLDKTSNPGLYKELFVMVLGGILGAVLGAMFGGLVGGTIGLLLGALITITALEFAKGEASTWDPQSTVIVVLSAILGAVLGAAFGGLVGGVIGFLLGALISFISIKFSEGNFNKSEAIASLEIALFAILGLILGTMFGGLVGGVIGLVVGLTFGFAAVSFNENLEASVRAAASKALKVALTTIIGALIGAAFGGGIFGGIVGGVIGLTFGLAVTVDDAKIKSKTSNGRAVGAFSGSSTVSRGIQAIRRVPALAAGAVIPPNREFLAVLGDQRSGTNIEAPLDTIQQALVQAMREIGITSGGTQTINLVVDGRTLAKVIVPQINRMTQQAGKPVLNF